MESSSLSHHQKPLEEIKVPNREAKSFTWSWEIQVYIFEFKMKISDCHSENQLSKLKKINLKSWNLFKTKTKQNGCKYYDMSMAVSFASWVIGV